MPISHTHNIHFRDGRRLISLVKHFIHGLLINNPLTYSDMAFQLQTTLGVAAVGAERGGR